MFVPWLKLAWAKMLVWPSRKFFKDLHFAKQKIWACQKKMLQLAKHSRMALVALLDSFSTMLEILLRKFVQDYIKSVKQNTLFSRQFFEQSSCNKSLTDIIWLLRWFFTREYFEHLASMLEHDHWVLFLKSLKLPEKYFNEELKMPFRFDGKNGQYKGRCFGSY